MEVLCVSKVFLCFIFSRYPNPKIYDSINDENSFYLSSGETIPLVFKYISFNKQEQDSKKSMTVTITKE